MAAVTELFRRLRSRRSLLQKKTKTNKSIDDGGATPQLGDRSGVALPPVPPPGFLNLPDISRDCVRSSSLDYDEIPAYAIDTRLDILRDAYMERKRTNSLLQSELRRQHPSDNNSSQNETEVRHQRGQLRDNDASVMRRHHSLPGNEDLVSGEHVTSAVAGFHRQGTPWNHGYVADDDVRDQLDQWVSVPESLNAIHLDDGTPEVCPGRGERSPWRHPWYEDDSNMDQSQWLNRDQGHQSQRQSAEDRGQRLQRNQNIQDRISTARCPDSQTDIVNVKAKQSYDNSDTNRKQYPSPPPGALSDDSGVSSPSSHHQWQSGTSTRQILRHYREYSDSDSSSTYYRQTQGSVTRWRHRRPEANNSGQSESQESAHARLDVSSSDTYNEYDHNSRSFSDFDSFPRVTHVNESMSPQEYTFYLGKIRNNLSKTRNVKSATSPDRHPDSDSLSTDWDATCDSIDLTSVTSLSEISTLSEREIDKLMDDRKVNQRDSQRQGGSRDAAREHVDVVEKTTSTNDRNLNTQPSAFRPYPSKHRYTQSSSSVGERIKPELTSDGMPLADRLSCRVTTSKPRPLSARLNGVTSQMTRVGNSQYGGSKTQNLLLSDLMKRNHDRQILVVI